MKSQLPLLVLLAIAACPATAEEGATRSPLDSRAWSDIRGKRYDIDSVRTSKATVFLFTAAQCPIANQYTPRIHELARSYQLKGVGFFLVYSSGADSVQAVKKHVAERKIAFPVVKDDRAALVDALDAHTTPEAVVLDTQGRVRYRGRIDDNREREKVSRHDVREAVDAILAGRPVKVARTLPFGCAIFRDSAATAAPAKGIVTYVEHVAPILNKNCVTCHRSGEVAPFSLDSYKMARVWAVAIKDYTSRGLMPPWKPVKDWGEFHDERRLTGAEIATLARWADSGAREGDRKRTPPIPKMPLATAWKLGTPDMVLRTDRPYHLDAEGRDVYRNFVLPVSFEKDQYVSAMEFRPDNRAVVHHVVTYLDPTGKSAQMDGKEKEPGYTVPGVGIGVDPAIWGEVWVPGNEPRFLPKDTAIRIPAGAKLVMQVHYHKSGKPEVDQTEMALYFPKQPVSKVVQTWPVGDPFFILRPGEKRNEVKASLMLPFDIDLRSVFPHMHMLGKEMKVTARLPDGTEKKLVWIDDWDFNWQATYFYKEPIRLPKGTRVSLTAIFDNSESNPRQTSHPPRTVTFGEQTTDEMCFCFLTFTTSPSSASDGHAIAGFDGVTSSAQEPDPR